MKSKEKEEDLVNKMCHEIVKDSTGKSIRCAIIAVDDILESKDFDFINWLEVKQYLEEML